MKRLILLLAAVGVAHAAESLIKTDFAGAYVPVKVNERVTGALPRGWSDNSSWAKTWVSYTREEEKGRPFLRVAITRHDDGACQFAAPVTRSAAGGFVRLRLTVRNPDRLSIKLGLRRNGAPYTFLWEQSHAWPGEWRDYTYYAKLNSADYDFGFYVIIDSLGRFDIARFEFDKVTMAEIEQDFVTASGAAPKNLVRNSRFPLGLQSGWELDRDSSDGDEVAITSDGTALHIVASKTMQIYSAPVGLPQPVGRHTASIYVRGTGAGALRVIGDGRVLAAKPFTASDEWQRVEVSFTPNLLGRAHGVKIEGAGELWLDKLQVERSDRATEFAQAGECEVSLAADAITRVVFDDEPAVVRYAVMGAGCKVKARVVDVQGHAKDAVAAAGGIRIDVLPGTQLGAFRVEAWAENARGEHAGPYNELVVMRLHRPRYWMRDAPQSPFGTHTLSTTRHIQAAKAVGVNWVRLHDAGTEYIGWYHLERSPGEWTFRDDDLYRYRFYGMKILGVLSTAPEWASYLDKSRSGYYDRYFEPRTMEPYANYVRRVTERYSGVIDTWDLWNEPWGASFWHVGYDEARKAWVASDNPPRDFALLTRTAAEAAKSRDPHATIVGLNSTTGAAGVEWTRGIVAENGIRAAGVICYHQYAGDAAGFPGDIVEKGFAQAVGGVPANTKPVWMTEGSPTYGRMANGIYRYTVPWEEEEDVVETSDRLVRFVVSLLGQGVGKVFLYSMHAHMWFGNGHEWSVLVNEDGYLHPSAAAHSEMAWLLEDLKFVRTEAIADGVAGYVFEGAGRKVMAMVPRGARTIPRPAGAKLVDLFGNPVSDPSGSRVVWAVFE